MLEDSALSEKRKRGCVRIRLHAMKPARGARGSGIEAWRQRGSPFPAALVFMRHLANALFGLFSALMTLALLEGGCRLYLEYRPRITVLDDEIGWVHRPNVRRHLETEGVIAYVTTNALGLRGPLPSDPGRPHLLLLGDSFTDGLEVSDPDLMSVRLQEARPDLAVYNGGVEVYGTVQERMLLDRLSPAVHPDLVLLLVYANDLDDNVRPFIPAGGPRPYRTPDGRVMPLRWDDFDRAVLPRVPGMELVYRHTQLYPYMHGRIVLAGLCCQDPAVLFPAEPRLSTKWAVLEAALDAFPRDRVIVVGLPPKKDVVVGRSRFVDRLGTIAARQGFRYISVQPALRRQDFYRKDVHWRASGHHAVAAYLAARLPSPR
jgi:hypothetical protein